MSKMYLVMAWNDSHRRVVVVYEKENLAKIHAKMAARDALALALLFGGQFKKIPKESNKFDTQMDCEEEIPTYWVEEVEVGNIQNEPCESLNVGETGYVPKICTVEQGPSVEGQANSTPNGVRQDDARSVRGLLQAAPIIGGGLITIEGQVESDGTISIRESAGEEGNSLIYGG